MRACTQGGGGSSGNSGENGAGGSGIVILRYARCPTFEHALVPGKGCVLVCPAGTARAHQEVYRVQLAEAGFTQIARAIFFQGAMPFSSVTVKAVPGLRGNRAPSVAVTEVLGVP